MKKPLLTIFTPTYNRAYVLERAYQSLVKQTSNDFLWQIIDDGSSDNTEEMIERWKKENLIPIKFEKQTNRGKTATMNRSIKQTETVLWLCLDSDDWLHREAVEKIAACSAKILTDSSLCGMIGLRSKVNGSPMQGKEIPKNLSTVNYQTLRYEMGIEPEYIEVFKTDIIKEHLYPEIPGETYFPISYVPDQLAQKYDYLVLKDSLMYCEYQSDGITKKRKLLILKNPIGYMLFKKQLIELSPNMKIKILSAVTYNSACILAKKREPVKNFKSKIFVLLTYPLGWIDYFVRFKLKANIHIEKTY